MRGWYSAVDDGNNIYLNKSQHSSSLSFFIVFVLIPFWHIRISGTKNGVMR